MAKYHGTENGRIGIGNQNIRSVDFSKFRGGAAREAAIGVAEGELSQYASQSYDIPASDRPARKTSRKIVWFPEDG